MRPRVAKGSQQAYGACFGGPVVATAAATAAAGATTGATRCPAAAAAAAAPTGRHPCCPACRLHHLQARRPLHAVRQHRRLNQRGVDGGTQRRLVPQRVVQDLVAVRARKIGGPVRASVAGGRQLRRWGPSGAACRRCAHRQRHQVQHAHHAVTVGASAWQGAHGAERRSGVAQPAGPASVGAQGVEQGAQRRAHVVRPAAARNEAEEEEANKVALHGGIQCRQRARRRPLQRLHRIQHPHLQRLGREGGRVGVGGAVQVLHRRRYQHVAGVAGHVAGVKVQQRGHEGQDLSLEQFHRRLAAVAVGAARDDGSPVVCQQRHQRPHLRFCQHVARAHRAGGRHGNRRPSGPTRAACHTAPHQAGSQLGGLQHDFRGVQGATNDTQELAQQLAAHVSRHKWQVGGGACGNSVG